MMDDELREKILHVEPDELIAAARGQVYGIALGAVLVTLCGALAGGVYVILWSLGLVGGL